MTVNNGCLEHTENLNAALGSLANRLHRFVVSCLLEPDDETIELSDLETAILAADVEKPMARAGSDDRRRVLTSLHHTVLPSLEDAGLVTVSSETVSRTTHPLYQNAVVTEILSDLAQVTDESISVWFEAVAHSRRRILLSVLRHAVGPLTVDALVSAVATAEQQYDGRTTPATSVEEIQVSLVHVHLPMLVDAGMIASTENGYRIDDGARFDFDDGFVPGSSVTCIPLFG